MPSKVNYSRISPTDSSGAKNYVYQLIEQFVAAHHPDLVDCRIIAVWRYNVKIDQDGWMFDGVPRKANPVEREGKDGYDIVLYLNFTHWQTLELPAREELVDRLLTSVGVVSRDGEPMEDEQGRQQYRLRKSEYMGFFEVLNRHGLQKPADHQLAATVKDICDRGVTIEFQGDPKCLIEHLVADTKGGGPVPSEPRT